MTARSATPRMAPDTVPTPPIRLAPPRTTAASTSSSLPTSTVGVTDWASWACTSEAMPAIEAHIAVDQEFRRNTWKPSRCAASRLPPSA